MSGNSEGAKNQFDGVELPFVDQSGDDPTQINKRLGVCKGSSAGDGVCIAMDLSFSSIEEWREHRKKHHPVDCGKQGCSILSGYKKDNAPISYCYKHIPSDPSAVYAWKRTNTKSVVQPPKADAEHPIEAALPDPGKIDSDG